MNDSSLIDVETLDFLEDNQTWLYKVPHDSNQHLDIVDWNLSCDWSAYEDEDYVKAEKELYSLLDNLLKNDTALLDKHKFDSRTYVRPKRRPQRPSIQNIVEGPNHASSTPNSNNKYMTYNKYNYPSPMLRLKTFNVDTNTDNSTAVKEFALKRRSLVQEDDVQFDDLDADPSDRLSSENLPSKPVNFDLSQPAHNIQNTFNRGLSNIMNERGSLNMFQSGESLMRMSPPSLVSSLMMESSGNFNAESLDGKKSINSQRDSGIPISNRESIDPMLTSMTLSILDEKDMNTSFLSQITADNGPSSIQYTNSHRESIDPNMMTSMTLSILEDKDMRTSFLSQTTYPDNDSILDSLPPSLVSSVNTSCVSNTSKTKNSLDANIFSSTTFTHLEQSEKLLSARPRCQMFNSYKRDSLRNSESYTKSREEACQIDTTKVVNENADKTIAKSDMSETVTLHYSNSKMRRNEEKENLNSTFEKDDAFYNEMGVQKVAELGRNSINVTLDKQELNEIIQARQKLSLARKGLPDSEKLPNQVQDDPPIKTIQLPNQTITVPKHSMENASELLSRRRAMNCNGKEEQHREVPRRNATFKKSSPKASMDATVVFMKDENNIIDINSATLNLTAERTLQAEEWGSQERAMVGSSESTDTATFSSSSPPDSVPDTVHDPRLQIASTPLMSIKKSGKNDLHNLHSTISPIYDLVGDKSYILTKTGSANSSCSERTYDMNSTTVINSATMVKRGSAKRDILAGKVTPEKKVLGPTVNRMSPQSVNRTSPTRTASYNTMAPPGGLPRKTGLPTSKLLRQYSSHKELRIPGPTSNPPPRVLPGRTMVRRGVYSSNPALSPTSQPQSSDSYTVTTYHKKPDEAPPMPKPPVLVRQGTETLRRERPQSQLVAPKDHRGSMAGYGMPQPTRNSHLPPPTTRPYSIAGSSQLRVARPTSVPINKQAHAGITEQRPTSSSTEQRVSALPRPSRLPAPRRALRPPSVYSVAPGGDPDFY